MNLFTTRQLSLDVFFEFFLSFVLAFFCFAFIPSAYAFNDQDPAHAGPASSEHIRQAIIDSFKNSDQKARTSPLAGESCFDYYKFPSIQISLGKSKDIYAPKENIEIQGDITNENDYPVVDGTLFARVARKNQNYKTEGNHIIDEFIAIPNIELDRKEKKHVSFAWKVPEVIPADDYAMSFFFSVGKKFNLAGLPFTNEVVGSSFNFSTEGTTGPRIEFDRAKTEINGTPYRHIGNWPEFDMGERVTVSQPLNNESIITQTVEVTYDLYYWDTLNEQDRIDTKKETIQISPKSSHVLHYEIPKMTETVYLLHMRAVGADEQSIVNIRLLGRGERARIGYPAITAFPLQKGLPFVLFSCFHSTMTDSAGTLRLELHDKSNTVVDTA